MSNYTQHDELPSSILIETTNHCILKCPVCATPWSMIRPRGNFPYAQFEKLLDQLDWQIDSCDFGWSGEPFLNLDLLLMVNLCTRRGIYTHIATNGMFLGKYAAEIVSSKLRSINVGLDGVNQEMVEVYRVGADFERIVHGVERLIREKSEAQSDRPHVTLQMLVMRHTEEAIDEFIELARNLGADDVLLKSFNIEEGFWLSEAEKHKMAKKFMPNNERFRRVRGQQNCYSVAEQISAARCTEVITTPVILWDGRVAACCVDFAAGVTFGNINTTPLKDMWLSEPYREYRQKAFRRELAICARCLYPGSKVFNLRLSLAD